MEQVAIRAWGNSQGIRIPKDILNQLELGISDTLDISVQNDAIVLKRAFIIRLLKNALLQTEDEYP